MQYEKYSNLILRLGIGFVFLWFGIDKFIHPNYWFGWIPPYANNLIFIDKTLFMYLMGVYETIIGILFMVGLFTRIVAALSAMFLFAIIVSFGIGEIMVRDVGLFSITVSLLLSGAKEYSLDRHWRFKI